MRLHMRVGGKIIKEKNSHDSWLQDWVQGRDLLRCPQDAANAEAVCM